MLHEHKQINSQQNMNKANSAKCKRNYTPKPSGFYPKNGRLVHQRGSPYQQTKRKTTDLNRYQKKLQQSTFTHDKISLNWNRRETS